VAWLGKVEEKPMLDVRRAAVFWTGSILVLIAIGPCAGAAAEEARQKRLADAITAAMEKHGVPGTSVAVIDDYQIAWAEGFGRVAVDGQEQITPDTLFQAASISKPVAAAGALALVQEGKLDLDATVNDLLKAWRIPDSPMTDKEPIKLRHLLSHTAGLTVHGFPGYAADTKCPTLVEILDGKEPANSAAIRSFLRPGYMFRYSGGGYCVLQQVVIDTTGMPFPQFMQSRVLALVGMTHSTYEQPLSESIAAHAAWGHRPKKAAIAGRWHVHPEK
jgi:CubicO group peptidase (beta-lactamase class C family)